MRLNLLGLELQSAMALLRAEGVEPQVTETSAPRRTQETGGVLRVVYASDDGTRLTAARFMNPLGEEIEAQGRKTGADGVK